MGRRSRKTSRPVGKTGGKSAGKSVGRSQLMELFLGVAARLGFVSDHQIAQLAQVGAENVANWKSGAVREFKPQKLKAALASLEFHIEALRAQAGLAGTGATDGGQADRALLSLLEIEQGSSPADLQREFRDRVSYDYLGHRFLYFEPQGALAWENLIKSGYEQAAWLAGVERCARAWLAESGSGPIAGPIARALGTRGLDVVSLGCGEGEKEVRILESVLALEERRGGPLGWLAYAPVDVSIPLLLTAAAAARRALARPDGGAEGGPHGGPHARRRHHAVLPFCADFEEGRLAFRSRLRTAVPPFDSEGLRLVLVLGNVFGNLRDEDLFVRQRLSSLLRPGDLAWIEVGLRPEDLADDPLFHMTKPGYRETAGEANRRLLLEGPYRRFAAATGRPSPDLDLRVWVREHDESARIPGSCNFTHDLMLKDERRSCTMLYSRRYQIPTLVDWFARHGLHAEATETVGDSSGVPRVGHLLLRRRA